MPQTIKVLGQQTPSAITATTLYTVPTGNSAVISTLSVCNLISTTATYRIAIRRAAASLANVHYIVYDNTIQGNDSVFLTIGASLAATDVITVYSSSASLTFNAYGTETY